MRRLDDRLGVIIDPVEEINRSLSFHKVSDLHYYRRRKPLLKVAALPECGDDVFSQREKCGPDDGLYTGTDSDKDTGGENPEKLITESLSIAGNTLIKSRVADPHTGLKPADHSKLFQEHADNDDHIPAQGENILERAGRQGKKSKKRRRKKIERALNDAEKQAQLRHQGAREFIMAAYRAFLQVSHGSPASTLAGRDDSLAEEAQGAEEADIFDWAKLGATWQARLCCIEFCSGEQALFNAMVKNPSEHEVIARAAGRDVLLPAGASFLMSDISNMAPLLPGCHEEGFNIILVDPPWENRSVRRAGLYSTMPDRKLLQLPMRQLVHSRGALLALWMTNREKLHRFVRDTLLPAWNAAPIATWHWLKVAPEGHMIGQLESGHHRPYEVLLLAHILPQAAAAVPPGSPAIAREEVKDRFVVVSVPGEHSRKPPVHRLLEECLAAGQPRRGLELFARELAPGWTSWGDQALHFQDAAYFHKVLDVHAAGSHSSPEMGGT